mgnify:CR=1 FL=1
MENDISYEHVFSMNLHEKLKQKIVAWIFCEINSENQLHVVIRTKQGGFRYESCIDDISEKIVNGYSTDYAAYEIIRDFRKYITRCFIVG